MADKISGETDHTHPNVPNQQATEDDLQCQKLGLRMEILSK